MSESRGKARIDGIDARKLFGSNSNRRMFSSLNTRARMAELTSAVWFPVPKKSAVRGYTIVSPNWSWKRKSLSIVRTDSSAKIGSAYLMIWRDQRQSRTGEHSYLEHSSKLANVGLESLESDCREDVGPELLGRLPEGHLHADAGGGEPKHLPDLEDWSNRRQNRPIRGGSAGFTVVEYWRGTLHSTVDVGRRRGGAVDSRCNCSGSARVAQPELRDALSVLVAMPPHSEARSKSTTSNLSGASDIAQAALMPEMPAPTTATRLRVGGESSEGIGGGRARSRLLPFQRARFQRPTSPSSSESPIPTAAPPAPISSSRSRRSRSGARSVATTSMSSSSSSVRSSTAAAESGGGGESAGESRRRSSLSCASVRSVWRDVIELTVASLDVLVLCRSLPTSSVSTLATSSPEIQVLTEPRRPRQDACASTARRAVSSRRRETRSAK